MKHARTDYSRIQDPSGKIPADEPVFLLRAQDMLAPTVVEHWVALAMAAGASSEIIAHAKQHADAMREWQKANGAKVPDMPPNRAVVPHHYVPSALHMGDCLVCGNAQDNPIHAVKL